MSGPRPSPGPPGRVRVTCTGRSATGHRERVIQVLQLIPGVGGTRAFTRPGRPPVTGFAHASGGETCAFRCGTCRRNPRLSRERLAQIVLVIAAVQATWDMPVSVDIRTVERAAPRTSRAD